MPKIVDHEKYREELLIKCFNIFTSKGYANITMRQIASELKISTGSLYHYFKNKKNILQEMFSNLRKLEIKKISLILENTKNFKERINLLKKYLKNREKFLGQFFLLTIDYYRHCNATEGKSFIKNCHKDMIAGIASALKIDKLQAREIFIFLSGLIYNRLIFDDTIKFDTIVDQLTKSIFNSFDSKN